MVPLDSKKLSKKLNALYLNWKDNKSDLWGDSDVLVIVTPPRVPKLRNLKSWAFNIWLLELAFPEIIFVFTRKQIHILCSQQQELAFETMKKIAKKALKIELVMHVKGENEDGSSLMEAILQIVCSSAHEHVVGCLLKEKHEGNLLELWREKLKDRSLKLSDVTNGLSELLAVKDSEELMNVKKAAFLTASAMKNYVVPKLEEAIDEEKEVAHSALSNDFQKMILEPVMVKVKLSAESVDICYPPVIQSGGQFDFQSNDFTADENLYYEPASVIIYAVASMCNSYCSHVARTLLIDANADQSKAYEVLHKAQEAAIGALKQWGKKFKKSLYYKLANYI